ncbi:MAG TPA: NADH-quinone oxidoreductase subunit C [Terriglobia bacterium]|nr:NADH-quinone oxidoreductase subunit C [Terriglobia bacterium]
MADEPKVPGAPGPTETPATPPSPEGSPAVPPPKTQAAAPAPPEAVAVPGAPTPPKPAAPKPPAPAAKVVVKPEPWSSPLVEELQKRFPGATSDTLIFRNQPYLTVAKESLVAVCEFLKSDEGGGYTFLTDETAVDYPKREKRFEIIYILYSFKRNDRVRLKVLAADGERIPSVVGVWPVANWLEREVFDMFGIPFDGHPDLRRILLPEEWVGHPLRKDYDILRQDDAWVQANLHIPSGQ